jgi:hypothetical protein
MDRHIDEVLASQSRMLERMDKKSSEIYPTKLANQYRQHIIQAHKWASGKENITLKVIPYHSVLENPFDVSLEINEFLGYKLLPELMAQRVDAKLYREKNK